MCDSSHHLATGPHRRQSNKLTLFVDNMESLSYHSVMPDQNDDARRRILSAVADGSMSPQEAADRLHELDHPEPEPEPDIETEPGFERVPPPDRPVRIRVKATARRVEIIGDPSVREATAEGAHEARHEGDTLVIEGEWDHDEEFRRHVHTGGFNFSRGRTAVMIGRDAALVVRMNPDLPLEVRVEAGALTTTGVHGPIRAHVAAGSARLDGFRGPLDVDVAAGGFKGRGRIDHGHSRIRCDAGSVKLQLEPGSSVRIHGEAHLGKVDLMGRQSVGPLNDSTSVTVGDGTATLDIECNLGSVRVTDDG